MNGESFRISQRSCSPEAGFAHPLFALYVKFLYLPAFRTSVFPMCSLLHRTHSADSPRPAMIPSPLIPALIPILAQVLVVAHSSTRQKGAEHWPHGAAQWGAMGQRGPRPMFPNLSDTEPLARPAALYPSPCQTLCNAAAPEQKGSARGYGAFLLHATLPWQALQMVAFTSCAICARTSCHAR